MKNKFIDIFLILIFNLFLLNYTIAEEFNFNVTELQITEAGNIITGNNRGVITTRNNEIIITADNFKYNKLTSLLEAEGNVKLVDKIADVIITTNEIFYLKDKEEIYTKGKSRALNGSYIQIDANEYFKYNKLTSLLEAKGSVKVEDKNKDIVMYANEVVYLMNEEKISTLGKTDINIEGKYNIDGYDFILFRNKMLLSSNKDAIITDDASSVYELGKFQYSVNEEILKGEKIKITTDAGGNKSDQHFFQKGFFDLKNNKFLGKDVNIIFHKKLFLNEENDPRVSGVSGYGDEFNTYLDKAVFTSCKKTDKCPPWKMTAANVRHDKIKKQIIYKNAWLNILDFPVVYFPKFFHPDPSVRRQSGLIGPEIGDHDTLGDSIYLPYFFVISDDKDFTIKPRLFKDGINVLQAEYRQETKNSVNIIDTSITTGHKSNRNENQGSRSHFFATSSIDLAKENFINSTVKIKFQKTSNDTYLKLFDFMKSPILKKGGTLETSAILILDHEDYNFRSSVAMYEDLSVFRNSDRYSHTLPTYDYSKIFNLENFNGTFDFNSSGNNDLSSTNVLSTSINNSLNFSTYEALTLNGIKSNFNISLSNNNKMSKNGGLKSKNTPQSELISSYAYNVSLPLLKETENTRNRLTPKLSLRMRPHAMTDNRNGSAKVNADTIFAGGRIGAEAGESLTLGVDFIKQKINTQAEIDTKAAEGEDLSEIEEYFNFKLGTLFRLKDESHIPIESTLNKKRSNIFGKVEFYPTANTFIDYAFSLPNRLDRFESNEISVGLNFDNFITRFNFTEKSGVLGNSNSVSNTTKLIFNEFNSLSFKTRRNREINLTEYYDLIYEYKNDCLIADIKYRKDYYNSADIIPKEELFFSITIVPFYTYSPDKMILNKDRKS
jgi:LPS-assembly protein|tara:strand:- start:495 stop:3167 length:2673 start_codon:yes stop_codon:yes gene_type:complete